jgi:hypothetical protein
MFGKLVEEKGEWNKVLPFEIELKFDFLGNNNIGS